MLEDLLNEFEVQRVHLILVLRRLAREDEVQRHLVALLHDRAGAGDHFSDVEMERSGDGPEVLLRVGDEFGHAALSPDSRIAALEETVNTLTLRAVAEGLKLIDLRAPRCRNVKVVAPSAESRHFLLLDGKHRLFEWDTDALNAALAPVDADADDVAYI